MIGITFDNKDAEFLRELLHWYSKKVLFGPNSEIAYKLYTDVDMAIRRDE
jgi:hypothetical protein